LKSQKGFIGTIFQIETRFADLEVLAADLLFFSRSKKKLSIFGAGY
jgi:hypothetical protein